ncbi:type II toxin-antitoxin system VapB family antitoxin [Spirosoma aerophilum]
MSTTALLSEISALPPELRREVEDFVAFLRAKKQRSTKLEKREFDYAKGKVKLSDDFDAPLDDFNEYM